MRLFPAILLVTAFAVAAASPSAYAHDHSQSATAFGRPGLAQDVKRTQTITLTDAMRFTPATLNVRRGETLRLRILNTGKLPHEFVLGTEKEINEHAGMMRRNPSMVHADASSVRVAPGQAAELIWQFSQAGEFLYACLVPGHWEAGMQGRVVVAAAGPKRQ